jgi:hypothetical protein
VPRVSYALLALSASAPACAAVTDFPDDPQLIDESPWRCVGDQAPLAAATSSLAVAGADTATVKVQVCDALGDCSLSLAGLSGKLCARVDVGCAQPLLSDIAPRDGVLEFPVPLANGGFNGYLAVSSASELCTSPSFGEASEALCAANPGCNPEQPDDSCRVPLYVSSLLFFDPPVSADIAQPLRLSILSSASHPSLARATGGQFDATKGSLVITSFDCDGARAAGVRYDMRQYGDDVKRWYMTNDILTASASETDATGLGGFMGVPPGFADVEAYNAEEELVGAVGVQIVARSISYASLVPAR